MIEGFPPALNVEPMMISRRNRDDENSNPGDGRKLSLGMRDMSYWIMKTFPVSVGTIISSFVTLG
jgi:hypothetical protein